MGCKTHVTQATRCRSSSLAFGNSRGFSDGIGHIVGGTELGEYLSIPLLAPGIHSLLSLSFFLSFFLLINGQNIPLYAKTHISHPSLIHSHIRPRPSHLDDHIDQIRPGRRSRAENGRVAQLLAQLLGPGAMLFACAQPPVSFDHSGKGSDSLGTSRTWGCCGFAGWPGSCAACASCGMLT